VDPAEDKYRIIVDRASQAIVISQNGIVRFINKAAEQLTGNSRDELIGKHFHDLVHIDDRQKVLEEHERILNNGDSTRPHRYRITHKAGHSILIEANIVAITWQGNKAVISFLEDATEHKKAESELERRSFFLDSANDSIMAYDLSGNIIYANKATCRERGYGREEILQKKVWELIPQEHSDAIRDRYQTIEENGELIFETTHVRKDGSAFHADGRSSMVDIGGEKFIIAVYRDITHRRQIEQALRENEQRYEALFEFNPDPAYLLDMDRKFVRVNQAACRISGYTREELIGRPYESIICEGFPGHDHHKFTMILEGQQIEQELEIVNKNGEHVNLRVTNTAIESDGKVIGVYGVAEDITESKRMEMALKESEEKYRTLVENSNDIIFSVDMHGNVTYVSPALERLSTYSSEDILGKSFVDLIHPDDMDVLLSKMEKLLRGEASSWEFRINNGMGYRFTRTLTRPIFKGGELTGMTGVLIDITERKEQEEALMKAYEQQAVWIKDLEQRNREITLMAEMGEQLQSCIALDEIYKLAVQYLGKLLPDESGILFILNESVAIYESVASWRGPLCSDLIFAPDDCWSLRRGRAHIVDSETNPVICRHISQTQPRCYMEVPLMAQGKAIGLLYIQGDQYVPGKDGSRKAYFSEQKQIMAGNVARQLAMAIANMKLQEALRYQATRDPLTGLFNRRYMEQSLEKELHLAHRHQTTFGVMIIDLDHFKNFNDIFGHEAGDCVLRDIAAFLQKNVRVEDIVCRYGGEEFFIILPHATLEITRNRAEMLRQGVQNIYMQQNGRGLGPVTISLGVAIYPEHGATADDLSRVADLALYHAKQSGRNCTIVGKGDMDYRMDPAGLGPVSAN
jgi:diguanylate cyclase (GGDEF)-like protein/PAS domain S-box-containing protein